MYVSFCGEVCVIFGRTRDASDDVCEDADVVHSVRIVLLCAMHELKPERTSTMLVNEMREDVPTSPSTSRTARPVLTREEVSEVLMMRPWLLRCTQFVRTCR